MPLKPGCWIFFSALTLRLVWIFLIYRGEPVADQLFYLQSAQNLATENRYLMDGFPTAYWPVGYSFFLSLFFKFSNYFSSDSLLVFIQCSQAILSSLSALLIYLIAKKRMSFSFAALAGLLYAFYPAAIAMAASFWSETLFVFFLLIAFYFSTRFDPQNKPTVPSDIQSMYAKISLGILSGLAIGLAAYVRPTALLYLPFLSLNKTLWDFKYQFKVILVRGMVAMLLLLPWALRNHQLLGHWVPVSTNFGPNLYIGHNPEMNGGYMNSSTMDSIQVSGGNEAEQSQKLCRLAIQYALHHPLDEIKWLVIKITRLLSIQRTPL